MAWSRRAGRAPGHQAWRRAVLDRDAHTCQIRGPRCTGRATEADHVIPVAEGGPEFDPANGQAACPDCHKAKTAAEAARGRARAAAARPKARREPERHPGLR